eukprot:NODE_7881_length_415_cov_0.691667.p4 GENE.NODE_7881_length_415_cov_0.691667~~NODE_7881_length_415_cov_0.691667.p4  ORF type:complete len:60 (-),score=16.39 NODE_7881_length_415_cov_0.691667:125-304(-)
MGDFCLYKVAGGENPADTLTKFLDRATLDGYVARLSLERESGRAASARKVAAAVEAFLA